MRPTTLWNSVSRHVIMFNTPPTAKLIPSMRITPEVSLGRDRVIDPKVPEDKWLPERAIFPESEFQVCDIRQTFES